MLKLVNINKTYDMTDSHVVALHDLSITFRNKEFVSILGPSGCGKTTTLNIIGGLDKYSSGDLIINGVSTKDYKDSDWDNYRNHRVGFVFQSYNLIPHQTVGQNIELSLILGGLTKSQRKQKVLDVLEKVGLRDKYNSKPNQLSGGQMQRVSIARALVNDPEIILADEPTGALDSKTSIQIMDLLKKVSEHRLVIMVTHNPELADKYSTRIVRLQDGELLSDSNPVGEEEYKQLELEDKETQDKKLIKYQDKKGNEKVKKKKEKTSMSLITAFSLSLKNLLTKKGRTLLVSFAGSIGIIGISLILALSSGFQSYIDKVEKDTLTTYPITITEKATDTTTLLMSMIFSDDSDSVEHDDDSVYSNGLMMNMMSSISKQLKTNDMNGFYNYLQEESNYNKIKKYITDIQYTYDLSKTITREDGVELEPDSPALVNVITTYSIAFLTYSAKVEVEQEGYYYIVTTTEQTGEEEKEFLSNYLNNYATQLIENGTCKIPVTDFAKIITNAIGIDYESYISLISSSNSTSSGITYTNEMISNTDLIKSQYDLVTGKWNSNYNEVILALDENNELSDYLLYALGFVNDEQFSNACLASFEDNGDYHSLLKVDYDSIIGKTYNINVESDYYYVNNDNEWVDVRTLAGDYSTINKTEEEVNAEILSKSTEVKIVGIVKLKKDTSAGALSEGLNYSRDLTNYLITERYNKAEVVTDNERTGSLYGTTILLDTPKSISIYLKDFESRDSVLKFINDYNAQAEEGKQISYSDIVGTMMSSITTIINAITYVLVGFVSVSLIVSSIMIGIITYISVLERTKEIGVLRSMGASKRDIKHVFSAETLIIGLTAGLLGIGVTLLLCIPVNIILKMLTGIAGIAQLPVLAGIVLVLISMLLTFIAGLVPSKVASKKDPVIALRTE